MYKQHRGLHLLATKNKISSSLLTVVRKKQNRHKYAKSRINIVQVFQLYHNQYCHDVSPPHKDGCPEKSRVFFLFLTSLYTHTDKAVNTEHRSTRHTSLRVSPRRWHALCTLYLQGFFAKAGTLRLYNQKRRRPCSLTARFSSRTRSPCENGACARHSFRPMHSSREFTSLTRVPQEFTRHHSENVLMVADVCKTSVAGRVIGVGDLWFGYEMQQLLRQWRTATAECRRWCLRASLSSAPRAPTGCGGARLPPPGLDEPSRQAEELMK